MVEYEFTVLQICPHALRFVHLTEVILTGGIDAMKTNASEEDVK